MKDNTNDIYINGKEQVIELMKVLKQEEKSRLLNNIKNKNPALARELAEHSFNFHSLWSLSDDNIRRVFGTLKPAITGLALYNASSAQQRRVLSLLPREYAIKAFEIIKRDLSANQLECQKAQNKVVETAKSLGRSSGVSLY